jgi:Ca2+-binding RTX toxin-like protein
VNEGTSTATGFYAATATDADAGSGAVSYGITGTDAGAFTINASTGELRFANVPDFETKQTYSVTLVATQGSSSTQQVLAVNVVNLDDNAPVFSSLPPTSVVENTTGVVYDANASDADTGFGAVTYTLGGTDAADFAINAANGEVSFVNAPDRETKGAYAFSVIATQNGVSTSQAVNLVVTDVNDNNPVFTSGATASVTENASVSTVVYDADATDQDSVAAFGAIGFSLGGADADAFTIDATNGQVRLKVAANFETKTSYSFNVVATQGSTATTQAVTLSVDNIDEGIAGLTTKTVTAESGSTRAPLGELATVVGATFEVTSLNDGGGAVYNGNVELAVGQVLTLAELNALTFDVKNDGGITFDVTNGGDTGDLSVVLDATPAVNGSETGGTNPDTIDAGGGNDVIDGKGGDDTLVGGAGKDTVIGGSGSDSISAGVGNDTVDAGTGNDSVDAGSGKDTVNGGSGADTIFGGNGGDSIVGGNGKDELHGGKGLDTLVGGDGADKFVFDTTPAWANADVIADFQHGIDKIVLESDFFAALGAEVKGGEFVKNDTGKAQDGNDRLIYETDTGKLFYDANGNANGGRVLIVTFDPKVGNLSYSDFEIV